MCWCFIGGGSSATYGSTVGAALLGNLFSPGRGLFVFSPVLLAAIPGFAVSLRDRSDRPLHLAFAAIVIVHWAAVSRFPHWWGGYCFGPRLMSDVLPFVTYFVGFAIREALARSPGRLGVPNATIAALAAMSVAIHLRGAVAWAPHIWSAEPSSIDQHPERLWDWSDLQFARGIGHRARMPDFGPLLPGLHAPKAPPMALPQPPRRPADVR